jgi:hypothetical protein
VNGELQIAQGTTYTTSYNYGGDPLVYKDVAGLVKLTPLTLSVNGHGVPDGYKVAFTNLPGAFGTNLNAKHWPPTCEEDLYAASVVDADTLAFNDIDGGTFGAYTTGGQVAYWSPFSLAGASGTFKVFDQDSNVLLTSALTVDDTAKIITATLSAAQTAQLQPGGYTYAAELTDGAGSVILLEEGSINIFLPGLGP